jgi:hypothetical protein
MQLYHSTDRDGITIVRPSVEAMQAVLEQLNEDNAAEADYPEPIFNTPMAKVEYSWGLTAIGFIPVALEVY